MWGFLNVASDVLIQHFGSKRAFQRAFPHIEFLPMEYKDAGPHLFCLWGGTERQMQELLEDDGVQRAAGTLVLRVMRKRATAFSRYHCVQLASAALERGGNS
ncbi:MAG: hypothetical protein DIJKHBIC_01530 [Thermoanaerobaculia bacterium]|nr:hypothetical protein [Thermoanaerobaculia bacterium]